MKKFKFSGPLILALVILVLLGIFHTSHLKADDVFRIQFGKTYDGYSNEELRRRVWELERAVSQLQSKVFQLEVSHDRPVFSEWTCHIQSFGATHVATGGTRSSALAMVLKKCGDATNPIHCHESDVRCDNQ